MADPLETAGVMADCVRSGPGASIAASLILARVRNNLAVLIPAIGLLSGAVEMGIIGPHSSSKCIPTPPMPSKKEPAPKSSPKSSPKASDLKPKKAVVGGYMTYKLKDSLISSVNKPSR